MYIDDEKKTYAVQGTVTISTDEYRDLVIERANIKAQLEVKQSEYWKNQSEISELKKRIAILEEESKLYAGYVAAKPERALEFFSYKNTQKEEL